MAGADCSRDRLAPRRCSAFKKVHPPDLYRRNAPLSFVDQVSAPGRESFYDRLGALTDGKSFEQIWND